MKYRQERLGHLIRKELSLIIARELEFDGALPTITDVDMSKTFKKATVRVAVWPSDRAEETVRALNRAEGELRHYLRKKLRTRTVPALAFFEDEGAESAAAVEKIFLEHGEG